jgi:hypothetical protein
MGGRGECSPLVQDMDICRALVKTVMNFRVPLNVENFLTVCSTTSFSSYPFFTQVYQLQFFSYILPLLPYEVQTPFIHFPCIFITFFQSEADCRFYNKSPCTFLCRSIASSLTGTSCSRRCLHLQEFTKTIDYKATL